MDKTQVQENLKKRFEDHPERHPGLSWDQVSQQISEEQWVLLQRMEEAGGEPDLLLTPDGKRIYVDTCKETPEDRRSVCYDEKARLARKNNAPDKSARGIAENLGLSLVDEATYLLLQATGSYDVKGQIWLATDEAFRSQGEALFGNRRHDRVFIYYNGAQSYYRTRGYRFMLNLDA